MFGATVSFLALISCQTIQEPETGSSSIATPTPTPQMAKVSGKPYLALKRGHLVYQNNCAKCHEHRLPDTVILPKWHAKVSAMSSLAGLSSEDEKALQLYLDEFTDR